MNQNRPPFIPTQRLYRLQCPPEKQRRCLQPATFRALRWSKDEQLAGRQADPLDDDCRWTEIPDRTAFLADPANKRLCITTDAGTGKTKAVAQTQFLRQAVSRGHLAIQVAFGELPDNVNGYLGTSAIAASRESTPLLIEKFQGTEETKQLEAEAIWGMIQRQIRRGRFTLIVDALDETSESENPKRCARKLAEFLSRFPEIRCVVAGRHEAIEEHWKQLFEPAGSWEFIQVDEFNEPECETFVGPRRWELIRRIDADVIAIPRSLGNGAAVDRQRVAGGAYGQRSARSCG